MLFGIKYETSKKGLNVVNMSLKRYDSAIMQSGRSDILFTNPIVAIKVSRSLNDKNKFLTYKVFKLSKEAEKNADQSSIVSTMEEYRRLTCARTDAALNRLKDLKTQSQNKSTNEESIEQEI